MTSKLIKFELNSEGVQELLKGAEMQSILKDTAAEKAEAAGTGYDSDVHVGAKRAYANVFPATKEAYYDNLDNNTLEKVIRS